MAERQNILIVDDNKLICRGLYKLIFTQNLPVTVVDNGKDALSEIRCASYQSVFLDINLPDMSGLDVLREIRDISPDTKVIVMTADGTDENRQEALDRGACCFLCKPFSIAEIGEILRDLRLASPLPGGAGEPISSRGAAG